MSSVHLSQSTSDKCECDVYLQCYILFFATPCIYRKKIVGKNMKVKVLTFSLICTYMFAIDAYIIYMQLTKTINSQQSPSHYANKLPLNDYSSVIHTELRRCYVFLRNSMPTFILNPGPSDWCIEPYHRHSLDEQLTREAHPL